MKKICKRGAKILLIAVLMMIVMMTTSKIICFAVSDVAVRSILIFVSWMIYCAILTNTASCWSKWVMK